jgi:hypothetical protein
MYISEAVRVQGVEDDRGRDGAFKDGRATYVATLAEAATKPPTCLRRRLQPQKSFSMGNLRASTKKFDSSSYLGKVGSGCVYKGDRVGHALAAAKLGGHNAKMIAIKKLRRRDSKATGIGSQEKHQLKQSIT